MTGLGVSNAFEIYGDVPTWVVGYTTAGVVFHTDPISRNITPVNAWVTAPALPAGAIGGMYEFAGSSTSDTTWGVRMNGSTDNRFAHQQHGFAIIGCDSSGQVQARRSLTGTAVYEVGYITDGATFDINGSPVFTAPSTWVNDIVPTGSNGGLYEVTKSGIPDGFGLSTGVTPTRLFGNANLHPWGIVGATQAGIVEGFVPNANLQIYRIGITEAAAPLPQPIDVTPAKASLATTAYAPLVSFTNNISVAPTKNALATTTYAPQISVTNNISASPAKNALVIAAYPPEVEATTHVYLYPLPKVVSLTGHPVWIDVTDHTQAMPGTTDLYINTYSPDVSVSTSIDAIPGAAGLSLSLFAPLVSVTANVALIPGTAELGLLPNDPEVDLSDNITLMPGATELGLMPFVPEVDLSDNVIVFPGCAQLVLARFHPIVTGGEPPPETTDSLIKYVYDLLRGDEKLNQIMGWDVQVYPVWARPDAKMPYIVQMWDMRVTDEPYPLRMATLWLHLWSEHSTTRQILLMRERAAVLLDALTFTTPAVSNARCRLATDGLIPDEPGIYHLAMRFDVRVYRATETYQILTR